MHTTEKDTENEHSPVYFGSVRQKRLRWQETLPAKLDLILERLAIRDRVKGDTVAIKMHLGGNVGYSTVHPVFVRKIVQAVKDGGGTPFVTDTAGAVASAYARGYTQETLGCPILPAAGIGDTYYRVFDEPYKNIRQWKVAGQVADATFLINLAHAKGHSACAYAGVLKNLALGCQVGSIRSQIHDTFHYDQYWFPEKCPDAARLQAIIASCPHEAIIPDTANPKGLHLILDWCNACGRCLKVAPEGSLRIQRVNFESFQEACAYSAKQVLSTFHKDKQVHMVLAIDITPLCDCFGMTTLPILPDVGIFGGNDICAVEQATLDALAQYPLMEENIPEPFEVQHDSPHPLQQLHGRYKDPYLMVRLAEKLGLGTTAYAIQDVMEEESPAVVQSHISAKEM
jgi:uncharacterized Fe-S center protein